MGRNSQTSTLVPNLTIVTFKMWAYSPQITENGIFWYKFAQKRYTPLSDFYNIWLRGGSQVRTLVPNFIALALKYGHSPQNREKSQFLV